MKDYIAFILVTIVFWGLWGFLSKLSAQRIGMQATFWYAITYGTIVAGFVLLGSHMFPLKKDWWGIALSIAAGVAGASASLFFFFLLQKKPAGLLVASTALYPLVTLVLSMIFLSEKVTLTKIAGFILAIVALFLLSLG